MTLTERDHDRLKHSCVRAAMVMIAWELDRLLRHQGQPVFCSAATLNLLSACAKERKEVGKTTRATVLFARRAAATAASLSWQTNVEIGPERCDA